MDSLRKDGFPQDPHWDIIFVVLYRIYHTMVKVLADHIKPKYHFGGQVEFFSGKLNLGLLCPNGQVPSKDNVGPCGACMDKYHMYIHSILIKPYVSYKRSYPQTLTQQVHTINSIF